MFTRLTKDQLKQKTEYINSYIGAINAASGSEFDPNANVTSKNVATLQPDLFKDFNVQLKRYLISDRIEKMYGKEVANEYNRQIEAHEIYPNDESHPIYPYCVSISMYPFLLNGLGDLGGEAKAPKHLDSFCGGFINLVYCLASQFAGACLYKDQRLYFLNKYDENITITESYTSKDFVSMFNLDKSFSNEQGDWEFADISDKEFYIKDPKQFTKVTKVYRRKYSDLIYKIKYSNNTATETSKDHKFMVDENTFIEAEKLNVGDKVLSTSGEVYIDTIKCFTNDDEYVYEIETESHVYSCDGIYCHNCATVEFLMCFDYFARKDFGKDYLKTHKEYIKNKFEQVVYSLNQPAGARSYQCPFWNISIFDKYYFEGMFGDFCFPDDDMTKPDWETLNELQKFFMEWFNKERERALLTFPVVTAASLTENNYIKDKEFNDFLCEQMSKGNSFFNYMSDNVDSLSSCCRLQNKLQEKPTFSFSLGAGGVQAGSINVITLNFNRLVQNADREGISLEEKLRKQLDLMYKYQSATSDYFKSLLKAKMLPAYDGGFINMKKQYLTIGINGMLEAAEYKGLTPGNNQNYMKFLQDNLKVIYECNKEARSTYNIMVNTEFVPAENLGIKNYHWDKKDGYVVNPNRNCYNSYFYPVEASDDECNIIDKFVLHGKDVIQYLDGGSALHLNLADYPTKDGYKKLFELAAKTGCNYWTTNIAVTCCEDCGYIGKKTQHHCHKCKSRNVTWATRIIGYLRKVTNFSEGRQIEEQMRHYHKVNPNDLSKNDVQENK